MHTYVATYNGLKMRKTMKIASQGQQTGRCLKYSTYKNILTML